MHKPIHSVQRLGSPNGSKPPAIGDMASETEKNILRHHVLPSQLPTPGLLATASQVHGPQPPPAAAGHRRSRSQVSPLRRAVVSEAYRRPDSDYRFTRSAGGPSPAGAPSRGPLAPPAHSSPFRRVPNATAAGRPIGWRPQRGHFPTARGSCGSPEAQRTRPWRAVRPMGARGAGPWQSARQCSLPASLVVSSPPLPSSSAASRSPAEPTHRRRAQAGWALGLAFAPPLSGCQSAERGTGLVEGKLLPRSPCPFPPPPALSLPRALGRGTAWERDGGVLTGGRA